MGRFSWAAVIAAAIAVSQGFVNAAVVPDQLMIRVYDNTGVAAADRARALARAGEILARVEVDAAWLECPSDGMGRWRSACDASPAPDEIVVRLVRSSAHSGRMHPYALGYSLIDTETGLGTLATVYTDRVERLSRQARSDRASVLGRAIAHEVGHLILGTNAHSGGGLMREVWTFEEVKRNRPQDWQFSLSQREGLQAARQTRAASLAARARTDGAGPAGDGAGIGGQNPMNFLNKTP